MGTDPDRQSSVIIVHDSIITRRILSAEIEDAGFRPLVFSSGDSFIRAWNNRHELFSGSIGIIIHQDLGKPSFSGHLLYDKSVNKACDVLCEIRAVPEGKCLRTILASGSVTDNGISKEITTTYQADGIWDPSDRCGEILPEYVVRFLKLGKVTEKEANEFRGKKIVYDKESENNREIWINYRRRNERW